METKSNYMEVDICEGGVMEINASLKELHDDVYKITGYKYIGEESETIETHVLINMLEDLLKKYKELEEHYERYVSTVDEYFVLKNKLPMERD